MRKGTASLTRPWVCVDANVVIALLTGEQPLRGRAAALWASWLGQGVDLAAPSLFRYEVTNGLYRLARAGSLTTELAGAALAKALAFPIRLFDDPELHPRAFELSRQYRLPAAYDAHYLALAERLGAELFTADQRLANAVGHALPWVVPVAVG